MLLEEIKIVDLKKAPTRYILSLFKRCRRELICLTDGYEHPCSKEDLSIYNLLEDFSSKLKIILDSREHLDNSQVKKIKRQLAAKRNR